MDAAEDNRRMVWASRRGMLELDLVLESFAKQQYPKLDDVNKQRYRALMECEDQELFGWFMRREQPEDANLAAIIAVILSHLRGAA